MAALPRAPLKVDYVDPALLKPDPANPRIHSKEQLRKLLRSIERFGFLVPILVFGKRNLVVAGHGCLQAALSGGLQHVPIIRLERLEEAEAKAFGLAHNRLAEESSWDDKLLGEVLKTLSLDSSIQLEDTGFSLAEIDLRIEGLPAADPVAVDSADALPSSLNGPPTSAHGDIWLLGKHRLLCGNALEAASYDALLGRERAHLVLTDSPYNVPMAGHAGGKGRIRHREFPMASGEMTPEQFGTFLMQATQLLAHYSVDGSLHYLTMDWAHALDLLLAGKQTYSKLMNICVWEKSNAGMGALYRSKHELVFVFKNGHAKHRNNVQLGAHGRNRTNCWHYASPSSFGKTSEEGRLLELHPTIKPVAMLADVMLDASARGEFVLDPFLGSGSTLIAAERVGRVCRGMELDPIHCDTAIRRWQRWTGEKAIHAASRRPFDAPVRTRKTRHG